MLRSMAAAALGGYVLCGINTTRRGAGLLADIRRSDCQLLLVNPEHRPLLDGLDLLGRHGARRDVAGVSRCGGLRGRRWCRTARWPPPIR